ncbi:MAG: hypothetical protein K5675_00855 [Lachnospiraceae bacterium]|nr:hypothetical protein [Lachnospiraceae bacterium]
MEFVHFGEMGELIRDAILKDFDAYNNGFDAYRGYIKDQLETNDIQSIVKC